MKNLLFVILILLTVSCVDKDPTSIPTIDLQFSVKSKDINLSDLLVDIKIITLETTDNNLLGQNTYYLVGEKNIISVDQEKILQFSINGEFIRTLSKAGKGPNEFLRAEAFALDEKNDILFLFHRGDPNNILTFNLEDGLLDERIPTRGDNLISQIIVNEDSILIIVPRMNQDFNFYYLTKSGNFISGFPPPKTRNIGLQTSINMVDNQLFYMPKEYDTLFILNNYFFKPYCFFKIDDRFSYINNEIGNFIYLSANAPSFLIANKVHASIILNADGETFSMNADKQTRYFISKKDFSIYEITDYFNDFLGFKENLNQWESYLYVTDDIGYIFYSAFEMKQKIKEILNSGNISNQVRERVVELDKKIDENDNPILFVGKLK